MDPEEAANHTQTDPELSAEEKEFTVGFTKKDDRARIHTNISSQVKRALTHSDIEAEHISVFYEDDETHKTMSVEDYDGEGIIVAFKGTVPIESIKIQSNPRSARSYAQIISPQTEVNFD